MMKKRNVAVAMAAVTMASTVAPVFANAIAEENKHVVSNENSAKLISKVRELLRVKYTDTQENVYEINATYTNSKGQENQRLQINTITDLLNLMDEEKGNKNIVLTITDNGHAKDGDKIVDETILKYEKTSELQALVFKNNPKVNTAGQIVEAKLDADKGELKVRVGFTVKTDYLTKDEADKLTEDSTSITVEESEDKQNLVVIKELRVAVGNEHLNIDKPNRMVYIDFGKTASEKNQDAATVFSNDGINKENAKELVEKLKKTSLSKKGLQDINDKIYEVTISDAKIETVKSEVLFDGLMLTETGKELVDVLENGIKKDGQKYTIEKTKDSGSQDIEYKINKISNDNYELVMKFTAKPATGTAKATAKDFDFELKVTGKTRSELEEIANIFDLTDGKVKGAAANAIIGQRRVDTAVQISKENFKPMDKNSKVLNNVVLVGANAVVDGLAAGPLAATLDAPLLLTNADSLDTSVEREIKRLLVDDTTISNLKNKTVYIVGGESVVSEKVVAQLEKLGVKVERIAGDRRDTTSLAVAEKMVEKKAKFQKAFVVGAKGEADAMSISAHASKEQAPIIVTALDGSLSKEAKKLIKNQEIDIIGGETAVSKELEAELKDIDSNGNITRVSGANRFETNANVITKYHKNADHIYIAKDGQKEGNDKLVDALAISPVAVKDNKNGVVVLATNDLTEAQQEALELRASAADKMTQVGGGVSKTVITKVAKMLGLVK